MGASGNYVKGYRTISADPDYLPIGSIIYVPFFANSPNNGFFVVEDTGSAVIGKRIDIYTHDFDIAKNFKEELIVYLVNKP
jgi:3D (Asp-Asp-Asp) domain-containing protein